MSIRRLWPVLALLAGVGLIAFEYHRAGGVTTENVVWMLIGAVVVVLSLVDLFQRLTGTLPPDEGGPRRRRRRGRGDDLPPLN